MAMRRGPGYHTMWGEIEKREKERERERKAYQRQVEREWKEQYRKGKQQRQRNTASNSSYSGYTPSTSPQEEGCIVAFVNFCFVALGLAAIILPFVWDFWTLFKVIFVICGIFSISIPFIAKSNKK